ncbi:hypothetical protein [Parashewanella tropica]|uniref:hypothetical protein n=1 Tax=Parashewanella tropica TaxID=2547970 RepID=UPI0010592B08|nr:hypothetical protein [Parashewanella tropica]
MQPSLFTIVKMVIPICVLLMLQACSSSPEKSTTKINIMPTEPNATSGQGASIKNNKTAMTVDRCKKITKEHELYKYCVKRATTTKAEIEKEETVRLKWKNK